MTYSKKRRYKHKPPNQSTIEDNKNPKPRVHYVYVMSNPSWHCLKIGSTVDYTSRRTQYKTHNPYPCTYEVIFRKIGHDTTRPLEKRLKELFRKRRVHGTTEFFHIDYSHFGKIQYLAKEEGYTCVNKSARLIGWEKLDNLASLSVEKGFFESRDEFKEWYNFLILTVDKLIKQYELEKHNFEYWYSCSGMEPPTYSPDEMEDAICISMPEVVETLVEIVGGDRKCIDWLINGDDCDQLFLDGFDELHLTYL